MDDEKKELEVVEEAIRNLEKAMPCLACIENVTDDEYGFVSDLNEKLIDRRMKLQIEIDGCIIQEV